MAFNLDASLFGSGFLSSFYQGLEGTGVSDGVCAREAFVECRQEFRLRQEVGHSSITEQMHIDFLLLEISFSVVMYRKYAFISDHRPGLEAKSIWNIPCRLPNTMCNVSVSKLNPDISNGVL